ncbi:Rieske (2Fe-2S) protein [Paenibacillus naphthalenovorans]|uniref:Rieske (2Fe-2S) protein n=1 Tax=Paenibacillus naphthalenovorans TaxID=162209 RepID=UPI0008806577|nr:Rieske (2Fe-2S) protein [Paenibacillus naphthalenovorans]SDJ01942.1 Ferredoxin subunit of nitrite reductase or a ring-hydroxylating dioxygenase [Paenibacillus naphthalenovorans]
MAWNLVAREGEIAPGKAKLVQVDNKQIGIFYEENKYYAILNICPHFHAEICKGHVTGTLIFHSFEEYEMRHDELVLRCPWHHWEFAMDSGKAVIPSIKQRLKTYEVKVEDGNVFVAV